ncbi:popeye domain-containing protein 3 isoform X3 [Pungitius pungitius]|uniref:popeye domain-containing protein 3 isoform X3 n=1 Tax=Pungitius pungitius TaxID=134920 RepID=UPI001886B851|nr:popeye domain-containing protein 3 isoform X3 [Pungitius pungitius]
MEPLDFYMNLTIQPTDAVYPFCENWRDTSEGSALQLANIFLFFGFMGNSNFYGLLYLFSCLTVGFFCSTLWAWSDNCTTDSFLWSFALFGVCFGQVLHVAYRLKSVSFKREFQELYRIRVTVKGEFLHFIYPFQFLDSPEWDSLRPSEEGVFQVTLCADNACRYVGWRRKKLYLLFAKHRYIAKIFALVVRNDIAEKLCSLNDKALNRSGHRYDIRLPSYCHMTGTELEKADVFLQVPI